MGEPPGAEAPGTLVKMLFLRPCLGAEGSEPLEVGLRDRSLTIASTKTLSPAKVTFIGSQDEHLTSLGDIIRPVTHQSPHQLQGSSRPRACVPVGGISHLLLWPGAGNHSAYRKWDFQLQLKC